MRDSSRNAGICINRVLRHHSTTGRSATESGSSTLGRSDSASSLAVISICSQQICWRCPNGFQHC
jgi:hypothetical protein